MQGKHRDEKNNRYHNNIGGVIVKCIVDQMLMRWNRTFDEVYVPYDMQQLYVSDICPYYDGSVDRPRCINLGDVCKIFDIDKQKYMQACVALLT